MNLFVPLAVVAVGALALAGGKKKKKQEDVLGDDGLLDEEQDAIDSSGGDSGGYSPSIPPPIPEVKEPPEEPWNDPDYSISGLPPEIDDKLNRLGYHKVSDFQSDYNKWSKRKRVLKVDNIWGNNTSKSADQALDHMDSDGADSFLDILSAPGGMRGGAGASGGAVGSAGERKDMLQALGYENSRRGVSDFQNDYNRWPAAKRRLVSDGVWGPRTSEAAEHGINTMRQSGASSFEQLVYDSAVGG